MQELQKIELVFYRTESGNEPARKWLQGLDRASRQAIGDDLRRLQFGWPMGMPLVRSLGRGLFELRSALPGKMTARLFFCFHAGEIYVLHGFIKKSRKLLEGELKLAIERKKEVDNG